MKDEKEMDRFVEKMLEICIDDLNTRKISGRMYNLENAINNKAIIFDLMKREDLIEILIKMKNHLQNKKSDSNCLIVCRSIIKNNQENIKLQNEIATLCLDYLNDTSKEEKVKTESQKLLNEISSKLLDKKNITENYVSINIFCQVLMYHVKEKIKTEKWGDIFNLLINLSSSSLLPLKKKIEEKTTNKEIVNFIENYMKENALVEHLQLDLQIIFYFLITILLFSCQKYYQLTKFESSFIFPLKSFYKEQPKKKQQQNFAEKKEPAKKKLKKKPPKILVPFLQRCDVDFEKLNSKNELFDEIGEHLFQSQQILNLFEKFSNLNLIYQKIQKEWSLNEFLQLQNFISDSYLFFERFDLSLQKYTEIFFLVNKKKIFVTSQEHFFSPLIFSENFFCSEFSDRLSLKLQIQLSSFDLNQQTFTFLLTNLLKLSSHLVDRMIHKSFKFFDFRNVFFVPFSDEEIFLHLYEYYLSFSISSNSLSDVLVFLIFF